MKIKVGYNLFLSELFQYSEHVAIVAESRPEWITFNINVSQVEISMADIIRMQK